MATKISYKKTLTKALQASKAAAFELQNLSPAKKKQILLEVARNIEKEKAKIIRENKKDLVQAKKDGLSTAMIDRLTLTPERIKGMAEGVRVVANLKDPIGSISKSWKQPNGLKISKRVVPIGVILIIYESRPNVTVECASLCLKSGNSVLLRGGREAFYSNQVLASIFEKVYAKNKLPKAAIHFIKTTDRAAVGFLLEQDAWINLVIPRGGADLIKRVTRDSRIPVIKHFQGICHVYVDEKADLKKAAAIAFNAKMQRPGVCNAMETLLVHQKVASKLLPVLGHHLDRGGCEIRADQQAKKWIPFAKTAKPKDFGFEFLDKILAVKVVANAEGAIEHIRRFGSGHTDAIITQNKKTADLFKQKVDSSSVMVNASTRFADGFEYGFGAEIGISTDKIHARGPMGLEGLTTYKYVVEGNGQVRL